VVAAAPSRRAPVRAATLLFVSAFAAALAGCAGSRGDGAGRPIDAVVVLPFQDRSGSGAAAPASSATDLFVSELRMRMPRVIAAGEVEAPIDSALAVAGERGPGRALLERIGAATGCDAVLWGTITLYAPGGSFGGDRIALHVQAFDPRDGRRLASASFSTDASPAGAEIRGMDQLLLRAAHDLAERFAAAASRP
jgi:hypothetical protein